MNSIDFETEDGELIFKNGDFSFFESNKEHCNAILVSNKGEWKQYPKLGVNLYNYINSPSNLNNQLKVEIKDQFIIDGFDVSDLVIEFDIVTNKMIINTNANRLR